jgi:hypothetical protein
MRLRFGNYSTRRTSPMTEIGDRVLVVRPDKGNFTWWGVIVAFPPDWHDWSAAIRFDHDGTVAECDLDQIVRPPH